MAIRKLPPHVINLIAAGEVVERPASVVKELFENSVDAGAQLVQVHVEEGGLDRIRVTDNGCGIPADEVPLALERHATSKLARAEDLAYVSTLGFRGEALAAIGAVSRLSLTTRTRETDAAVRVRLEGGTLGAPEPAAHPVGTTIEVLGLFYNAPVRKRFLRSAATEFRRIVEVLSAGALAAHDVGVELTHGARKVLALQAGASRRERVAAVLGQDTANQLLPVVYQSPEGGVEALIGPPSLTRSTANGLYLVVNRRPVQDRLLVHAVREAYRDLIPAGRHPVAVLYLDLPAGSVDMNVHPAKAEVRLLDPQAMHALVRARLRERVMVPGYTASPGAALAADAARQDRVRESIGSYLAAHREREERGHAPAWSRSGLAPAGPFERLRDSAPDLFQAAGTAPPPARYLHVAATYLVVEQDDGLLLVDQHALHERVMYSRLLARSRAGASPRQRLLVPVPVQVGPAGAERLESMGGLLETLGLELRRVGDGHVLVSAVPPEVARRSDAFLEQLVSDLVAEAQADSLQDRPALLDHLLKTMACRAAVKAGDVLSPELVTELLALREQVEGSTSCPHGRPTSVFVARADLERWFLRR